MRKLRTILTWTTALLFVALAGGCHADPASPDWSSSLAGSWVGHIGVHVSTSFFGTEGGADCGQLEAVLNVARGGEITGTWALPSGHGSCGSYAGTLQGSLARDFVTLRFTTSTGSNLFLELAHRVGGYVDVAAGEVAVGHVFSVPGGQPLNLELAAPVSLPFVDCEPFGFCVGVPGAGYIVWRAVPSQS